jgi:endonuclease YncB( thermonuclease family)
LRALAITCLASLAALALSGTAQADPCKAIPDHGPVPAYLQPGRSFSGPVARVLDGDSLCVAVGDGPANWVEVRLSDFYAPESSSPGGPAAKAALERIALGKFATCTAGPQSYDRVVSACTISGRAIGQMMRAAGIAEGGRGYPEARSRSAPRRLAEQTKATPQPTGGSHQFHSCREARAAGAAPMYRGEPDYNPNLDGDGDGIACEPYRGR